MHSNVTITAMREQPLSLKYSMAFLSNRVLGGGGVIKKEKKVPLDLLKGQKDDGS